MLYRTGLEVFRTGDNGEQEQVGTKWDPTPVILRCTRQEEVRNEILKTLADPATKDTVANKRIQILAVLDEFTLKVETTVKGTITR